MFYKANLLYCGVQTLTRAISSTRIFGIVFLILFKNVSQIGGFGYQAISSSNNNNNNNNNNNYNMAQSSAHGSNAALALFAVGPESALLDTHRLAKRMDLESCLVQFDVHQNTIIRTGESQAIGGKYLQGVELETMEECQRLCCETESCDVYIFEYKNGGYCYLFECGPPENFHCKFTRHANYTSALLTPVRRVIEATTQHPLPATQQAHSSTSNISQQERELTSLKVKPETGKEKLEGQLTGNAAQSTLLMGLGAQLAANSGLPQITQPEVMMGFPQKGPNTTVSCGRFQFTCHSGECIAVYNACDGIPQCEDGSDEGPECSGATSNSAAAANSKSNQEASGNNVAEVVLQKQPQQNTGYQQTQTQQQLQQNQQQLTQLQQQQQPVIAPPLINNREDSAAWANRKIVADNQQNEIGSTAELNSRIFNHKGGLQVPTNGVATFPNPNLSPMYAATLQRSGIYLPQPQDMQQQAYGNNGGQPVLQQQGHILVPSNVNWQQQQQANIIAPGTFPITAGNGGQVQGPAYIINGVQQQPMQPQIVQQQQLQTKPLAVPLNDDIINMPVATNVQQQQSLAIPPAVAASNVGTAEVVEAAPKSKAKEITKQGSTDADDEYENSEEESTEPPKKKQRKHKKVKPKAIESKELPKPKDPIELALEQQKQHPQPPSPVHEQYKMIHENLAMEFRDHDGQSERPGGAVLSLTLGLLVTAALAILIGCRMRTVGRRSRRLGGKTPYAHEADFLVNGMYL